MSSTKISGITDEAALEAHDLIDAEERMEKERDKRESISSEQSTGSNESASEPNKSNMGNMGSQKPSLIDRGKEALGLNRQ
ncbi:hypothetical protein NHJ13734_000281 [Beauveria thailandica]